MSFEKAEYEVSENDQIITTTIIRTGDLRHESTVRCYTRQDTARVAEDFNERPDTDKSIIVFSPGRHVRLE